MASRITVDEGSCKDLEEIEKTWKWLFACHMVHQNRKDLLCIGGERIPLNRSDDTSVWYTSSIQAVYS